MNVKKYDLIGIGELTRGELTSWKYRLKIVKYLTKYYDNVIIFCENLDPYISNLNNKNNKFIFSNGFYPFIIPQSNKSIQHLEITKKFNKLVPKVKFYGIDIQVVRYKDLYNMLNIKIKRIIDKYKDKYLKDLSSSVRNECNSFIINDLILEENSKNNKNIYLYFAHNEHIALDCNSTRKNENYKTEGFFFE